MVLMYTFPSNLSTFQNFVKCFFPQKNVTDKQQYINAEQVYENHIYKVRM
jgi:hypothetical protein